MDSSAIGSDMASISVSILFGTFLNFLRRAAKTMFLPASAFPLASPLEGQPDMHDPTRMTFIHAQTRFFRYFKPNEQIGALNKDRMEKWKEFFLGSGDYAAATVAGTIRRTKTVFCWAKGQQWITESPLTGVAEGSFRNPANDRDVTMEEYRKLLDACPDQEWRVIIALARIGGLRPCEILVLRWSDIGIGEKKNRIHVFSPKMNPHEHLRNRVVPLFPVLGVELGKLRSIPGNEGPEYVINRYVRNAKINLVQPFNKIAEKADNGWLLWGAF